MSGSANSFPGHIMAGFYDVVVVTFNYRLGALGMAYCLLIICDAVEVSCFIITLFFD